MNSYAPSNEIHGNMIRMSMRHTLTIRAKQIPAHDQRVWLIKNRRTYFGLHLPHRGSDLTKANLLAFHKPEEALKFRMLLCTHQASAGEWPRRVADENNKLTAMVQTDPAAGDCCLEIDEYPFVEIVRSASLDGMAVALVESGEKGMMLKSCQVDVSQASLVEHLEALLTKTTE